RNFIFMHDNARPHTANITRFFQEHNITSLDHPANSPNLNPIEYIWDEMERRLRRREQQPQNFDDLAEIFKQIWNEIPQELIRRCINMRERLQAVIEQREGNTQY
ncbi:Transposable element Tc1 transposase, partial [Camponotus floridanus]